MLDLPFANESFDVVIEKGSLDVLFVDNDNAFDPKAEVKMRVFQMLEETHRYLFQHAQCIPLHGIQHVSCFSMLHAYCGLY